MAGSASTFSGRTPPHQRGIMENLTRLTLSRMEELLKNTLYVSTDMKRARSIEETHIYAWKSSVKLLEHLILV